jgi:hypothetical protein
MQKRDTPLRKKKKGKMKCNGFLICPLFVFRYQYMAPRYLILSMPFLSWLISQIQKLQNSSLPRIPLGYISRQGICSKD